MSDELGWVKLHRSILKQPWFKHSNTLQLFIYLLLSANRVPGYKLFFKGQEYELQPGQYWTTLERLKLQTGLTSQNIRTAVMLLKSTNTITSHSSSKGTIYSLCHWHKYQEVTNKVTNDQQTTNKPLTTEQELKKLRTKERTRRNPSGGKSVDKCNTCDDNTGFKRMDDGLLRTECDCLDKK